MGRDRARESCHRCGGSDSSFCECKTAFRGNPAKSGLLLREMVPTAGLEPATSRLGGGRSVPTELRGRGCGCSPDLREPPARYTCRAGAPGTGAANPGRIRAVPRACHATDRLLTPCHLGHRSAAWHARVGVYAMAADDRLACAASQMTSKGSASATVAHAPWWFLPSGHRHAATGTVVASLGCCLHWRRWRNSESHVPFRRRCSTPMVGVAVPALGMGSRAARLPSGRRAARDSCASSSVRSANRLFTRPRPQRLRFVHRRGSVKSAWRWPPGGLPRLPLVVLVVLAATPLPCFPASGRAPI